MQFEVMALSHESVADAVAHVPFVDIRITHTDT